MKKEARKKILLLLMIIFVSVLSTVTKNNAGTNDTNFFNKIASNSFLASYNYNLPKTVTHFDVEPQSATTYTKPLSQGGEIIGSNANVSAIRSTAGKNNQIQYSVDGGNSWATASVRNAGSEWQTSHNLRLNTANLVVEFQIQINEVWYTVKLDKNTVYPANTYVRSNVQNPGRLANLGAKRITYNGVIYYDISGLKVFDASNITCPDKSGIDLILSIATILTNQEVNVNVEKAWEGTIPNNAEVTLKLLGVTSSGETFELSNDYTVTLNQNNNWKHTFTKVSTTSKTENYILDKFTVEETKVMVDGKDVTEDYKTTITQKDKEQTTQTTNINGTLTTTTIDLYGITIKNAYTPKTTSVTFEKIWNDNNNQDGLRDKYTVTLTGTIIVDGNIKTVYTDEKTLNPDELTYTWNNLAKYSDGKEITYTIDETKVPTGYTKNVDGYKITNTHTPEVIDLPVEKVWLDNNNQDGIRPTEIIVNLLANGQKVKTVKMTSDANGKWLHTFNKLPKYNNGKEIKYTFSEEAVEGYEVSYKDNIIENTHNPSEKSITVNKIWNDSNNNDGIRPEQIEVRLIGKVGNNEVYNNTTIIKEEENWTYTFVNLPKYNDGKEITYTIDETKVPAGYTKNVDGYKITNTHTPEVIDLPVEKVWLDNNNQDGIRPTEIIVNLLANGQKVKTVKMTSDANGKWLHTFNKLPKYNNGKEIKYTFSEEAVEGYEVSYKDNIIENTHNPSEKSITVNKIWNDSNNNDGIRPEQIEVRLIGKVGNNEVYSDTAIIKEEENWTYTFVNLPEYNNGSIISYTLEETPIEGYTTNIEESEKAFVITNTHEKEQVIISGEKTWDDNDNQDGKRPATITINLLANGEVVETKEVSADSNGNWAYTFTKDKYQDKEEIKYTLEEVTVEGYTTIIEEGSYNITNYHKPETLTYTINKEWLDDEDNDGIRPDSINVSLLANGKIIEKIVISKENNWTYTFENLPRYSNGEIIEYTIIEDELKGYTPSIDYGEYDEDNNSITTDIKNNHEKEKLDDIVINKIWNDSSNEERPDSIEVIIYANGEYYTTITLSNENDWVYTLTNLDKYKNGVLINYTIEEVSVPGYETSYDGYTIINNIIIPAKGGDVEELPPQTGIDNITYENKNGSSEVIMFILLGLLGIKVLKRNY